MRNSASPPRPGDAERRRRRGRARPPTTLARSSASASGPSRSTSAPQPKLAMTATIASDSRIRFGDRLGQAHRLGRDDRHDDDDRVHGIGVEEPAEEESAEPGHRPGVPDRRPELAQRPAASRSVGRPTGRRWLADDEEERDREQPRTGRPRRGRCSGPAGRAEDQQPDEDRPAVADRDADPGQLAARLRVADGPQRRVVVDQRGLVGEVRDDEQEQSRRSAGCRRSAPSGRCTGP